MNVTITGASGMIGAALRTALASEGHKLHVLSRNASADFGAGVRVSAWDPLRSEPPAEALDGAEALIHLAGEPVAQRWTPEAKARIRDSRVHGTRHLVQALSTLSRRPAVLVCASAIGIYGNRGDEILNESSSPGAGFLPSVCKAWEEQASLAEALGIRVVKMRIGIVLGKRGGALEKMLPPFNMFVGGKLGSGRQWMSWIHLNDLAGLFLYALKTPIQGVMNGTAPSPVTNAQFTKTLAATLHRPALLPAPAFVLKMTFGEMAEILVDGQRVLPQVAQASGYKFQYPELDIALKDLLG